MKMMVERRTKDELVSVISYEYGLNNRLEKETKKQGRTTKTYRYRYDDNGMKPSGFGRKHRQHQTIREMSSYRGIIKGRHRPFMIGDIMMDSTN
jgi:hypothetical protein